ncbi:MAG TPA: hypothetical protein VFN10_03090 [Thermoanaerobaculia bacterium]|nr:hypothetical protein [Thermoanaerobaculia bacterium]
MEREQVVRIVEALANGVDPETGARIPHETFHSGETVRALFQAATWLKEAPQPAPGRTKPANPKFASAGAAWTAEEDVRLGSEFDSGLTVAQMALQHGRSSGAITSRLVKLGRLDPSKVKSRERGAQVQSP